MPLKRAGDPVGTPVHGNRLIDGLPPRQRAAVLAQCESIEPPVGTVLCEAGEPFEYAYFPITGSISVVKALAGHEPFEIESIGSEGMLGVALILDVNRIPQRGIVQTPCRTLRMKAKRLRAAVQSHPVLLRMLQRYLYFALLELSQTTACTHFHDVGKRLARGLLLAQDRVQTDHLPLTHQLLAEMLGVQREAVTFAAIELQREGIIRYSRGKIFILDRERLEASACGCYGARIENYTTLLS